MAKIKFVINGQVPLSRRLQAATEGLKNMSAFYSDAIDIIEKRSNSIFEKKGSNVEKNNKWARLADSTAQARAKRHGYYKKTPKNPSVLRWTGKLQSSMVKAYGKDFGSLTFTAPYAIFHQNGGKNLPKRSLIDLSNQTNEKIVKALQKKIHEEIGITRS